jgi:hypothetical protein
MPFGKHRGQALSEIPGDYINWLLDNCGNLRDPLKSALIAEQQRRGNGAAAASPQSAPVANVTQANLPGAIRVWHRSLVEKFKTDPTSLGVVSYAAERLRLLLGVPEEHPDLSEVPNADVPF